MPTWGEGVLPSLQVGRDTFSLEYQIYLPVIDSHSSNWNDLTTWLTWTSLTTWITWTTLPMWSALDNPYHPDQPDHFDHPDPNDHLHPRYHLDHLDYPDTLTNITIRTTLTTQPPGRT